MSFGVDLYTIRSTVPFHLFTGMLASVLHYFSTTALSASGCLHHTIDFQIVCAKVREGEKRIVRIKEGDPAGRHVVIVDDLVQSGGTLIECQVCKSY